MTETVGHYHDASLHWFQKLDNDDRDCWLPLGSFFASQHNFPELDNDDKDWRIEGTSCSKPTCPFFALKWKGLSSWWRRRWARWRESAEDIWTDTTPKDATGSTAWPARANSQIRGENSTTCTCTSSDERQGHHHNFLIVPIDLWQDKIQSLASKYAHASTSTSTRARARTSTRTRTRLKNFWYFFMLHCFL